MRWLVVREGEALLLAGVHSVDVAASGETGGGFSTTTNLLVFSLFFPKDDPTKFQRLSSFE